MWIRNRHDDVARRARRRPRRPRASRGVGLDDDRVGRSRHRRRDAEVDATRAASSSASSAVAFVSWRWAVDGYLWDRTRFEYDGLYGILGTWTSMYYGTARDLNTMVCIVYWVRGRPCMCRFVSIVGTVALSQH